VPTEVVGEGDVDVAVIRAIARGVDVPKPEAHLVGRVGAIRRAAAAAKLLNRQIALVLDRNGFSPEQSRVKSKPSSAGAGAANRGATRLGSYTARRRSASWWPAFRGTRRSAHLAC
jgi:hypothetical protein